MVSQLRKNLFGSVCSVDVVSVFFRLILLMLVLGSLGACVSAVQVDEPTKTPPVNDLPDVQDRVVVDGSVLPLPEERAIASYSLPKEKPVSPVVRALTRRSQEQSGVQNYDGAANSLERALRIEPRNPVLWNQLADVRYLQKSWKKAIQLAAKSNTLSGDNKKLRRENWYLMSNSYKALGDIVSEKKYRDKLLD